MPHPAAMRQLAQCDLQRFTSRFNSRARPSRNTHSLTFPSVAALLASPRLLNQFASFRDTETWRVLRPPP